MARLSRLSLPQQLHWVVQRAHGTQSVFVDDEDRLNYLDALKRAARTHRVAVHAYALMTHEVHWLATPETVVGLSRTVQAVGQRFVAEFNRRHGVRGTRWDGRFRSAMLEGPSLAVPATVLLLQAARLDLNPFGPSANGQGGDAPWAGHLDEAFEAREAPSARWSSERHHLGLERLAWLHDTAWHLSLGNTPFEREAGMKRRLSASPDWGLLRAVRNAANRGWALGQPDFLAWVQSSTNRPTSPKRTGRPSTRQE